MEKLNWLIQFRDTNHDNLVVWECLANLMPLPRVGEGVIIPKYLEQERYQVTEIVNNYMLVTHIVYCHYVKGASGGG